MSEFQIFPNFGQREVGSSNLCFSSNSKSHMFLGEGGDNSYRNIPTKTNTLKMLTKTNTNTYLMILTKTNTKTYLKIPTKTNTNTYLKIPTKTNTTSTTRSHEAACITINYSYGHKWNHANNIYDSILQNLILFVFIFEVVFVFEVVFIFEAAFHF